MRPRFALFLLLASVSALAPLAACGSTGPDPGTLPVTPDRDASRPKTDAADPPLNDDGGAPIDAPSGGPGRVYAHTKDTLYLYEPVSGSLTPIAPFTFDVPAAKADVIDIAVDRTGNMFATTFNDFMSVDPITAKCTEISLAGSIDYPNSLTFVPAGTLDPGKEALVGYASLFGEPYAQTYVVIDTVTGKMTTKGNMNATKTGPQYRSSGDIISLIQDGNRTYATVKLVADGAAGTDLLAEVDPVDGHVKRIIGDTKQNNLFGFGYWAGKGYGFSDTGRIVQIDMTNGSSVVLKTLTDDAGAALPWYGAGVTTQAPVR
jgi:hypothetical protein